MFSNEKLTRALCRATPDHFTHSLIARALRDRLSLIRRTFESPRVLSSWPLDLGLTTPKEAGPPDLVIATDLHRQTDPLAFLAAIEEQLADGGVFLGCMVAGDSLRELKKTLFEVDTDLFGGAYPRIHPLPDKAAVSRLLHQAGFALPVVDSDKHIIQYRRLETLLHDIRDHGDGNALAAYNPRFTPRAYWQVAGAAYPRDAEGFLPATLEIVHLIGWKDHRAFTA